MAQTVSPRHSPLDQGASPVLQVRRKHWSRFK
jgi:hypothetical protein